MSEKLIQLLIVAPNQMSCDLLSESFRRKGIANVVGTAVSIDEAMSCAATFNPNVAVVHRELGDGNKGGLSLAEKLFFSERPVRCLVLAETWPKEDVLAAFQSGARGIMSPSDSGLNMLHRAVQRIAEGQIWANSEQVGYLVDSLSRRRRTTVLPSNLALLLSTREQEVVGMLAEGFSNKEIASKLQLSEHTVKNHLFRIFEKMGVSSRTQALIHLVGRAPVFEGEHK